MVSQLPVVLYRVESAKPNLDILEPVFVMTTQIGFCILALTFASRLSFSVFEFDKQSFGHGAQLFNVLKDR
ncbi:MAG: hypothetical protein PXY39_08355 [archaeon]|nr:hypothetical protein [archaeon]